MVATAEQFDTFIATAIKGLSVRGVDVSKYRDFSSRDFALAQAGKVGHLLKNELERRKLDVLQERTRPGQRISASPI